MSSYMSARQQLLAQPTQSTKWYSGDSPTSSEIMARIFTIGKTDPEEGKRLFTTYQTMQADPSSPIYNPYTRSTNKAINELAALGADVSRGIDDTWLAGYDWLKKYYRMETGNTPLAPSSKSSTNENAAYWYYRVLQAEPTTKAAEQEWEALQEEIAYWTGRSDRNYSDDEVLAKIDWSNYPTLIGMDRDAAKGLPTVLNRPVGYSQDALRGVIWAARNGGNKADPYNSVRAALGQGNTWQENADISAMLDPTNERYNPYAVGSTLDDAALYFGVSSFDQEWLDANRGLLSGTDETAKRYYQKVYDAEQTTQKAEAELKKLQERIDRRIENGYSAESVLKDILDEHPTLLAMQNSLSSGDLKATTRAINFSLADITDYVVKRVAEQNGKPAAAAAAAPTIAEQGTPEEQIVFRTAYSEDFMTRCQELNAAIEDGAPNLAGEYAYSLQMANEYTSQHYFGILEGMRPYEAVLEEIATIKQEIDAKERLLYNIPAVAPGTGGTPWKMQQVDGVWYQFGAELDPATREWKLTGVWNEDSPGGEVSDAAKAAAQAWISGRSLEPLSAEEAAEISQEISVLKQKLKVARDKLTPLESAYRKAAEQNEAMTQAYDALARLRELTGVEAGNATGYQALMEDIYTVGAEYKPTEWSLMSRYEYASSSQLYSDKQLATIARENADIAQAEIARLQKMLDMAEELGIDVPDNYAENINREIARLGREIKDAEYFILKTSPEFKAFTEEHIKNAAELTALLQNGDVTDPRVRELIEKEASVFVFSPDSPMNLLSEDDATFAQYLAKERGLDEAEAFVRYMTDEEYGRAHLQHSAALKASWESATKEMPVATNLFNILISPFRLRGVGYAVESWLSGKEINPGNEAFMVSVLDSAVTETSKQMIDEAFADSTAARWHLNLGYDVAKAVGESVYNMKLFGFLGSGLSSASAAAQTSIGSASLKILSALATSSPMGFQAASTAIQDAKYRGASDDQALLVGASTFLAETMTEAITVDNIRAARSLKTAGETKAFIKVLISDMLEEGAGEAMSEAITSLSDDWIMGELSNRNAIIQAAIDDGMTLEEAEDFATKQILNDILYAGVTGMLSSAVTTTAGHVTGKLNPDDPNAELPKAEVADGDPNAELPKAEVAEMETDQSSETEDGMPLMQESFGPEEQKKEADQKAKSELFKSVTALTAAATADTASQSATITAVLTASNASHGVEAVAAAAAQHMVNDMGGARAATKLSNILLTAAENGISPETVKVAVSTAALTNGPAHEALVADLQVTPEYVNDLISLSNQELGQPETVGKIRQSVNDNQVAMKVVETANNGAFAEIAPFEDAVDQAKTNLRNAKAELEREQNIAQAMGQSLQSLNAEFIEDPTNQMLRGAVQQAIKDLEGQAKVIQEYKQGVANAEEGVQKAERDLESKRGTLLTTLRQQAQAEVDSEQQAAPESESPTEPAIAEETTQESTEKPTQLKPWQDPQYHGKVKAPRKLKTNTKNFEKWFSDPTGDLSNPDGTPKVIYRGTGSKLYMEHKAKSKQKSGSYLNFYSPDIPIAASYANGSDHVFTVYDIVNWETAAAAMKAEGYELREEQNLQGEWGYRAYGVSPETEHATGDFYKEDELNRFNKEYGQIRRYGLYAGFVSLKNPLVIDANGSVYDDVEATVKDEKGNDYHSVKSNREWAEWARDQGYDGVIVRNVKDYLYENDHTALPGTVIMTFDSQKFKSIYNTGKLGKKNADIRYNKAGTFALTGEPISSQMKAVLDTLALGKPAAFEDVMNTPEVLWAEEHQMPGESLPWRKEGYTEEDIAEILPEERILLHAEIEDTLLDQGSAVIDENGKVEYTGPVKQEKRVDIVIGPPGAGKSSALANPLSQAYSSRIIDSDAIKELLPEYEGGLNSGYLNTESRYVWKGIVETSIANGDNIVLPVVGRSLSSVMTDISAFRKNGYSVNVHYLELDGNKVLGRALNRFLTEGRYITPEYLMPASDGGITDVYEALKGEDIDGYSHWNNDVPRGQKPQLLEASDPDLLADLDGRTADQRGAVDAGNRKGPPSESGTGGTGEKANAPVTQYAKASSAPPAQSTSNTLNRKLASAQQIAKKLAKRLGVGDYIGTRKMNRVPQGVRGYYETRAKYIVVSGKQAGNYATTMHELGHALADKIGMTGTAAMVNALDPVFAASYSAAELPGEAFAEFFALYSVDESSARNFAGDDFVDAFQRKLKQTGLNKDVQKAVDQLRALNSASVNEQIGSTIRSRSDKQKLPFREQWNRLKAGLIDSSAAAENVNHEIRKQSGSKEISLNADIRKMALFNNSANKRAFKILCENLTDSRGDIIGDALNKVLADAGLIAKNEQLFERYILALHSLARDEQGKPVFDEHLTKSAREAFIKQVEQEHPEFRKVEEALQNWRKAFMQAWMVDTGYLSQAAFDAMNAMYEHYVPTRRVKDPRFADQNRSGGRKYQIRQATGSTEDIWSPMDTFADMVSSIVSMVSQNKVALAWDTAYRTYSLGEYGRAITPDSHQVSVDTTELRDAIEEKLSGDVEEDLLQEVLDLIGEKQTRWVTEVGSKEPNTLVVQRPDGTHGVYTIADPELFKLLAGANEARINGNPLLVAIAKITRGMTALTTGNNPIFGFRNAARDFQVSVNYGSWASNYLTAIPKWGKAFYEVWRNSGDYQAYSALGGGGWTRVETGSKKGSREIRSELYKGYAKSSVSRAAGHVVQKLWNAVTLARFNEIVEQTSRFVEYKYGKHDLTTPEGRIEAFLAAQDVTVDFARTGNSQVAGMLKAVVPFFNASLQGVYRTGRMLTEAERGRAPARFAKTVVNYALMSALANGILLKFLGDDEKEEYAMLSDDMKAKHLYFPNIAPDFLGKDPLIRVPLGQDPLGYAVHGLVSNAMWSGQTDDDFIVEISAIANTILDNINPFGSGSVFEPLLDVAKNTTWYGSPIVPERMESWNASTQYDETTPELFKFLGRATKTSPLVIQYLAEQYTGFAGQMLIPALSRDENTGELGGLNAAIAAAQKRLTSDPLVSNDVVSSFYDGADALTEVTKAVENNRPLNNLRRGLTPEEATEAYELAKEMLSADGIIGSTKKKISELYNEIDAINANQALSDDAKYAATRDLRRKIMELALDANEAVGTFKEQYITGDNLVTRMLTEGVVIHAPTAYEKLEPVFKEDENLSYMTKALEVYNVEEEAGALPHPNTGFEITDSETQVTTKYEIEPAAWGQWVADYRDSYETYLVDLDVDWNALTYKQKLAYLKKAHTAGHNAAKKNYIDSHPDLFD